ncbi:MAG: hypothetical protein WC369_01650 [Dehalococcoidales bacterium]|jgi:hypothetical protein
MKRPAAIALLLMMNLTAHFMPFERAALAPDDYATLVRSLPAAEGAASPVKTYADRPLNYAFLAFQAKNIGDNAGLAFILLFLSACALLLAVFILFEKIFGDTAAAFVGAAVFCLLPNKLETYHTLIFLNINLVSLMYVISLALFISHAGTGRRGVLLASVLLYAAGIFWYEVGFFMPLLMLSYCFLDKRCRPVSVMPFMAVAVLYAVYRFTGAYGMAAGAEGQSHSVSLSMLPLNLKELFHHYAGRYAARSILYGFYNFAAMQPAWLAAVSTALIALVVSTRRALRNAQPAAKAKGVALFGLSAFLIMVLPIMFNDKGGIGGRHLLLPSVGISIMAVPALMYAGRAWKHVLIAFVVLACVVGAGNAWTQAVACRINGAVFEYLKSNRQALVAANAVVIDTNSFAEKIKYTLVKRDFNLFNTYYGAQAFEDWGLMSMVRWVLKDRDKQVYVSVSAPYYKKGEIKFCVYEYKGYRSKAVKDMRLPAGGTLVVGAKEVFGADIDAGIRKLGIRE